MPDPTPPVWAAEIVVDAALVRRLVGQFPELDGLSLRPLSQGWDRSVWLVAERWVFGFPHKAAAVQGVANELALLPVLAPRLPLTVPVPVFAGVPVEDYPWPFWGAEFLPGRESCELELAPDARRAVGLGLAGFLRCLHSAELVEDVLAAGPAGRKPELAVDPNARSDMSRRVPMARTQLEAVRKAGLWDPPEEAASVLAAAEALPPLRTPPAELTLAHGDLHFRHVLLAHAPRSTTAAAGPARITGIIDWVDLCRADPGVDLQMLWSFLGPAEREPFLAAYGPVPAERLLRARALALSVNAALAAYGHATGMRAVQEAAIHALARTVRD